MAHVADLLPGIIQRVHTDKRFGFVRGEDGTDYFFHASALSGGRRFEELLAGDPVKFQPGDGPKGPRADSVLVA